MSIIDVSYVEEPIDATSAPSETVDIVVSEESIDVSTVEAVDVLFDEEAISVTIDEETIEVLGAETAPIDLTINEPEIVVIGVGEQGPPGVGNPELYDSSTPPSSPTYPYLRFERDVDGDVQTVYLGTVD